MCTPAGRILSTRIGNAIPGCLCAVSKTCILRTVMPTTSITTADQFRQLAASPHKLRLFMLAKLPMAYLAGLRVHSLSEERAEVIIRYKYLNKNPFNSIYFASLSMAAGLSTGLLCMGQAY